MEHIVSGCIDCPMYSDEWEYKGHGNCQHPKIENWVEVPYHHNKNFIDLEDDGYDIITPITPDWCPLNSEPITIIKQ